MVDWPRPEVMGQMIAGDNLALITSRMTKGESFAHAQVSRNICEVICMSAKTSNNGFVFPLWIREDKLELDFQDSDPKNLSRHPNFSSLFLNKFCNLLNLSPSNPHNLPAGITPEDVFHYFYAVLHSPKYRIRYVEFLKMDFPRLPLTGSLKMFLKLAKLGHEIVTLHLLDSSKLSNLNTEFIGNSSFEVEKISWLKNTVWIDKAQTTGFKGVSEEVWNFHVGGYKVCEKWLKDRKGRKLSKVDITHYQQVVFSLLETIRLMEEIDVVVEQYGGWPMAFE